MLTLNWKDVIHTVHTLHNSLRSIAPPVAYLWPIPRGGLFIAGLLASRYEQYYKIAISPTEATFLVDEIIDTGRTASIYEALFHKPVVAPYTRSTTTYKSPICATKLETKDYLVFPWEHESVAEQYLQTHLF